MDIDWNHQLVEQLELHWRQQLRPRLDGLSDDEYFWEPVPGSWSIRRRADARTPLAAGAGDLVMDYAMPPHDPEPVTTIAWRLAHIVVGVFGSRNASHFGAPPADYPGWEYAETAAGALRQLDEGHDRWIAGVRSLGEQGLARAVGPAEAAEYAETPMAELVLHIHREAIHHGAEICLLRDLYLWKENSGGL
jgi:DinB superfamily